MQALGFNTYRYKLAAFVIAGLLAGVAGHMWAMHRGFVNPELIGWHRSAEALLMILIGGLGTLHGPIIGALAFTGLTELPQVMEEWKPFAAIFNAIGLPKVGAVPAAAVRAQAAAGRRRHPAGRAGAAEGTERHRPAALAARQDRPAARLPASRRASAAEARPNG